MTPPTAAAGSAQAAAAPGSPQLPPCDHKPAPYSGPSRDGVDDTRMLAEAYRAAGYRDGVDLRYVVQQGAAHNEIAWRARLPAALRFLLGPRAE